MITHRLRARASMRAWVAGTLGAASLQVPIAAQALAIEFDYRYDTRGFFTDTITGAPLIERRAVLEAAASYYGGFNDTLAAIAPGAGNTWSVQFTHPSLDGAAVTLVNEVIPADTLRVFVGGSNSAPGVLGFANVGDDLSANGSPAFVDAVKARGQVNATGPLATDYGTWGGMIWFNAAQDWYFGASPAGLTAGRPDFLTTATHEIGHILGFGEADSWFAQIDANGRFAGAQSVAVYGEPVPLDRFAAHWAEGTMSTTSLGPLQETLMDPSTVRGERERPTVLDYAGFADVGWQVSAVPEPQQAVLFGCGGLIVLWLARLRGLTRNEPRPHRMRVPRM